MGVHLISKICTMPRYKSKYVTARMLSCTSRNSSGGMSRPAMEQGCEHNQRRVRQPGHEAGLLTGGLQA